MAENETIFPVGSILEKCNQQIHNYVELVSLGRALITNHKEIFPFAVFTDVTNTVRTNEQNVDRLLQVVKARGLQGFVKFVSTLLNDRISNHVILGRSLLAEGKRTQGELRKIIVNDCAISNKSKKCFKRKMANFPKRKGRC